MSNEWAHVAARKGVPTEMINLIHDGHVLTDTSGRVQAGSAGAYLRCAGTAQLVQDRGIFVPARPRGIEAGLSRPDPKPYADPKSCR